MYVNDRVLPQPGSFVCPVLQSAKADELYMVIACRLDAHPGPWYQYEMTLLRNNRIQHVSMESTEFHNDWHVLHRP